MVLAKLYEFFRPVAIDRERFVPIKSGEGRTRSEIGDVCSATISGKRTSLVSVYVCPNTSFESIEEFSVLNLMAYSPKLKGLIETLEKYDYNEIPTLVGGDSKSRRTSNARDFIEFRRTVLRLELRLFITTPSSLKRYISYFSTHRYLLSIISYFNNSHILNDKNSVV